MNLTKTYYTDIKEMERINTVSGHTIIGFEAERDSYGCKQYGQFMLLEEDYKELLLKSYRLE
jgi:hypothetical protein